MSDLDQSGATKRFNLTALVPGALIAVCCAAGPALLAAAGAVALGTLFGLAVCLALLPVCLAIAGRLARRRGRC